MALPFLYIYHPPESLPGYDHIPGWLGELASLMAGDAKWDGCKVVPVQLTDQLGFEIANEVRRVKNEPGPVVFVHKAQRQLQKSFAEKLQRHVKVYSLEMVSCANDIFTRCQEALAEYEGGEPRITKRELVAYLIIAKLARGGYWAGSAKAKAYLTAGDLPNGGFPRYVSKGDVADAADVLYNAGLLARKPGDGRPKWGLVEKAVIQPILDSKSFAGNLKMEKWFQRGNETVPARHLNGDYG